MSYEQLSNTNLQMAMQKLMNRPMQNPEAFKVMHIGKAMQKEMEKMRELFKSSIMAEYSQGGEAGAIPTGDSLKLNLPFNALVGKEAEAEKAVKDFGKREFTIPFKKITAQFLFSVGEWSPVELQFLDPVVAELAVATDPEEKQLELPFPQK